MRALVVIVVAGCFEPTLPSGFPCGTDDFCPSPLECQSDGICRNPDEEPPPPPPPPNVAFVSSRALVPGSLGSGGLDALRVADLHCESSATTAGFPGRYIAWLSTQGGDPRNNVANAFGTASGWIRPDGKPVVETVEDLLAGRLLYPLRVDETRARRIGPVMTATNALGLATGNDCASFMSPPGVIDLGTTDGGTEKWTIASQMAVQCSSSFPVFCFQVDHEAQITRPTPTGLIAFLSDGLFQPTLGLMGADQLCQAEAVAAEIPGTFLAFLATSGMENGPISRFTSVPNQQWVRIDGVPTTRDFMTWEGSISVTSRGNYIQDAVFVGATSPIVSPSLPIENCNDWNGGGGSTNSKIGDSARADIDALGRGTGDCMPHRLYCLQTQ